MGSGGYNPDKIKIAWEGDKHTETGLTSRLLDRIGPVGRFGENKALKQLGKIILFFSSFLPEKNSCNKDLIKLS